MRDQRSSSSSNGNGKETASRQDRRARQAVLVAVIDLHPVHVTVSELVRQMTRRPDDFGERDRIEQAAIDLAGVGLLHRHDFRNRPDALVAPTQAALCANELLMDETDDEKEDAD